jgi:hypothetical protein
LKALAHWNANLSAVLPETVSLKLPEHGHIKRPKKTKTDPWGYRMKPRLLQISISFLTSGILLLAVVSFILFSFYSNKSTQLLVQNRIQAKLEKKS